MVRRRVHDDGDMLDLRTETQPGTFGATYPSLWSFLWDCQYEGGDPRVPGSLLLFRDGAKLKGCLMDKDANEVAFLSGDTPEGLLMSFDVGIERGDLDWREAQKRRK